MVNLMIGFYMNDEKATLISLKEVGGPVRFG